MIIYPSIIMQYICLHKKENARKNYKLLLCLKNQKKPILITIRIDSLQKKYDCYSEKKQMIV